MKMDRTRDAGWSLSDLGALVSGALLDAWSTAGDESWADTRPQRRANPRRSATTGGADAAPSAPAAPVAIWGDEAVKPKPGYSVWRQHEMRAFESEIDQWRSEHSAARKQQMERGRKGCQHLESAHLRRAR